MSADSMELTFWGVRGSIPTPAQENLGYGGNTSCVAIRCAGAPAIILDAGTGLRKLGEQLLGDQLQQEREVHIFLSHFHWDHVHGIPAFAPLFRPETATTFHSAAPPAELRRILEAQMGPPYFPVPMPSHIEYRGTPRDGAQIGPFLIRPFALNHPGGSTGFRVEAFGRSIVYATDHEHGNPDADLSLRRHAEGAGILIYDAQYTPEEYERHRGWGHSTWKQAVELARDAEVQRLILFHHDPRRCDRQFAALVREAQSGFENTMGATEGWSVKL